MVVRRLAVAKQPFSVPCRLSKGSLGSVEVLGLGETSPQDDDDDNDRPSQSSCLMLLCSLASEVDCCTCGVWYARHSTYPCSVDCANGQHKRYVCTPHLCPMPLADPRIPDCTNIVGRGYRSTHDKYLPSSLTRPLAHYLLDC